MIKLDKVSKKFGTGVFGLSEVSLNVEKGEFVFLVGSTGAGKSTIFRLLIRDTLPTEGEIEVNGWDVVHLPKNKLPTLRKNVGVVFQDLKLLLDRTIFENVMLPLEVAGASDEEAKKIVEAVLGLVGLTEHKDKFPVQLSGGELQRVAIARALVLSPEILLADEPTGNLDAATSWEIVKLLSDINKRGTTVVMATHNLDVIKSLGKRVIRLEKGKIVDGEREKKIAVKHQDKKEDKEQKEKIDESVKVQVEETEKEKKE
jgi:cell division transport system ATP-binding protein